MHVFRVVTTDLDGDHIGLSLMRSDLALTMTSRAVLEHYCNTGFTHKAAGCLIHVRKLMKRFGSFTGCLMWSHLGSCLVVEGWIRCSPMWLGDLGRSSRVVRARAYLVGLLASVERKE